MRVFRLAVGPVGRSRHCLERSMVVGREMACRHDRWGLILKFSSLLVQKVGEMNGGFFAYVEGVRWHRPDRQEGQRRGVGG
jgi:hypothetical protein